MLVVRPPFVEHPNQVSARLVKLLLPIPIQPLMVTLARKGNS